MREPLRLIDERNTLRKVRDILRGERDPIEHDGNKLSLNMDTPLSPCSTAACIGGHAYLIENPHAARYRISEFVNGQLFANRPDLDELFYAWRRPEGLSLSKITAAQAANAIDNFLKRGAARWNEVLA